MAFDLKKSIEILERTPHVLTIYLQGLSEDWIHKNEGPNTWSPYNIVGHLIYGEKTDWIIRIKTILSDADSKVFEPFDRFAQFNEDQSIPIDQLLKEFAQLRAHNLKELKALNITLNDLKREGVHPEFGLVTLKQLIAAWTVHDLGHISQISRVMATQYTKNVGPWTHYLGILKK